MVDTSGLAKQQEAFGDIKGLIAKFKKEREGYKEHSNYISTMQTSGQRVKSVLDSSA